jgi:hypothetical protein
MNTSADASKLKISPFLCLNVEFYLSNFKKKFSGLYVMERARNVDFLL